MPSIEWHPHPLSKSCLARPYRGAPPCLAQMGPTVPVTYYFARSMRWVCGTPYFQRLPNDLFLFHLSWMRIPPHRLTIKALLALEQVLSGLEPLRAGDTSLAVKLTLAFLFAAGRGERWPFDQFWQQVSKSPRDAAQGVERAALVNAALNAIYLSVGVLRTNEMQFYRKLIRQRLSSDG